MIFGAKINLVDCNKELWHEFYKNYVSDSMMENTTYVYNYENVENNYYLKTNDTTRQYFFIFIEKKVIGQICLKHIDREKETTEIGIALINDSVKGKGYGTEAVKLLIDYVFNTLCFEKIFADSVLRNIRSQHILENFGFAFTHEDSNFRYYVKDNK